MSEEQIDDGGPAFPVADTVHPSMGVQYGFNGMSLLDWFAGQALIGLVSDNEGQEHEAMNTVEDIANAAYFYAEWMIKERNRRNAN